MDLHLAANILQNKQQTLGSLPLSLYLSQPNMIEQTLKLQNTLEEHIMKCQILQLLNLKNKIMQQSLSKGPLHPQIVTPILFNNSIQVSPFSNIKPLSFSPLKLTSEPSLLVSNQQTSTSSISESPVKGEARLRRQISIPLEPISFDRLDSIKIESSIESPEKNDLRQKLRSMLYFLINNFGKINEDLIKLERNRYKDDKQLVQVFDILVTKYSGASKSREEMIKYILRKALKSVRSSIQKRMKLDYKDATTLLCKRYFQDGEIEPVQKSLHSTENKKKSEGFDDDDEGEDRDLLKAMLPFRKNSKNKTMNSSFITEIFSSEQFCRDYDIYLKQIDDILAKDNCKKIESFLSQIEARVKKNQTETLRNAKRLPWLKAWIDSTKCVAFELATTKSWVSSAKK